MGDGDDGREQELLDRIAVLEGRLKMVMAIASGAFAEQPDQAHKGTTLIGGQ